MTGGVLEIAHRLLLFELLVLLLPLALWQSVFAMLK